MKNGRIAEWKEEKISKRTVWRGEEERRRGRKRIRKYNEENFTCVEPTQFACPKNKKKL